MSNKIDFFGYEGKMTYENQNSGIRTFQMDIDLLHKINSFTLNVMKEEEFKPKDVIRDFRMTSNGDFSFKCGGGYKISDELVGGDASGVMSKTFEYFLEYDKDKDIKDLDRLNEFIDENKDHIRRMFPNAEKFEGFNKEYDFTEEKIVDLELEKGKISVKTEILDDLEECSLKYRDKNGKITENETKEMVIPNTDLEKYFKYVFDNDYNIHPSNFKGDINEDDFVKKFNLEDKLPNFTILSPDKLLYNKNDSSLCDIATLKETVLEVENKEFWDNMNLKDIRSYETLAEKGVVSICYEKETDEKGEVYTKSYTDFEEYSENVVNSKKKEIINEEVQSIKKELMKKTDIENNFIKTKDFFKLKEKYEKELEKVEDKLENLKGNKEKVVNKEEVQEKVKEEKELEIE
jgi:putative tetratricopeptide repeat-containing protein